MVLRGIGPSMALRGRPPSPSTLMLVAVIALFTHEVQAELNSCSTSGLAKGCVFVEGGCWCATTGKGYLVCDRSSGYSGEYYSITGRSDPTNLGASPNKAMALNILSALGLPAHPTHCVSRTYCDGDCATNRLDSSSGSWGTALTCWTNQARWDRTNNIVRCTNFEVEAQVNECNDGTENNPQVALPPPVLAAPNITSNNYILRFDLDKRYERVQVVFGEDSSNACNFDSFDDISTQSGWTVVDSAADPNCGETITFTKNAQTMIASSGTGSCDFARSTVGDNVEFTKRLSIITNQTRTIEYQQGFRNSTYQELKYTHYVITIIVPTTVTVNSAVQNVTGNITVLQAITNIKVDVDSAPYKVGFTMLTSSQAPYQLTYSSFSATGDLGTSITRASDTPACADNNFNTPCVQSFVYSDLSIVTNCDTKNTLNDAVTITYDVGCKSTFTGNCITPSPSQISVSFTLISTQYCPQTQDVTISAILKTYKDLSLDASSDWQVADESTNFVVGSTVYGQVEVTVGENAATTATTKIRTLTTHTTYSSVPTVVYSGGSGVTGVTVEQGDTANGGSANWPSDHKQARFSMLLANPTTVALDPVSDAAQAVIITAVVDVTYTTAGSTPTSPLLQNWHEQHHGQVRLQSAQSALGTASSTVGVGSAGGQSAGSPSASSTSIAGMAATTVVAVACALVLLVVAAAYVAGRRNNTSSAELQAQKESVLSLSQLRSSSAVDVTTDVEDATDSNSTSLSPEAEDSV